MKLHTFLITVAVAATGIAHAAVSQHEARQLGNKLTRFGAVKAGNKTGTIPPYTGGLKVSDPAYKETPYPYASEKPRLVIDSKNMAKYADKLDAGTKALMKRYPGYHINVYPSHRSASYPKWLLKKTVANATDTDCKIVDNGLGLSQACRRGLPFPIPKNGKQILWDHLVAYSGIAHKNFDTSYYEANGHTVPTLAAWNHQSVPYYAKNPSNPKLYRQSRGDIEGPPRQEGVREIQWFYLNPSDNSQKMKRVWIYQPGLRRVRRAPDASHDVPFTATGGNMVYSEQYLFSGMMDRFNYKLVGKKEMFIPYNNFNISFNCPDKKVMTPRYANPKCLRWELHRVWVIKATLKPGKHDIYSKRMYYFDEDTYQGGLYDSWDHAGQLDRVGLMTSVPFPKYHVIEATSDIFYNLNKHGYFYTHFSARTSYQAYEIRTQPWPESMMNARNMQGSGIR